jgi:hypothetical protein
MGLVKMVAMAVPIQDQAAVVAHTLMVTVVQADQVSLSSVT